MALSPTKMAKFAAVGIEFTSPMIAGALIGHYLDLYFHTDPWQTLGWFLLGVFLGFHRLIYWLTIFQKDS
ncbi:MAG: AtpZ/AtpI family protein [Candidatus Binataceae bacterium]